MRPALEMATANGRPRCSGKMKPLAGAVHALRSAMAETGYTFSSIERYAGYKEGITGEWFAGRAAPRLVSFEDIANACGYDVVLVKRGIT